MKNARRLLLFHLWVCKVFLPWMVVTFFSPGIGWWGKPSYGYDTLEVDFSSWISDIVSDMPGSGTDAFVVPTSGEESSFLSAVQAFLAENWTSTETLAAVVDYELVQITDTGWGDQTLYGLIPASGNTDYRGYYFLRPNSAVSCALVIEAPHPKYDTRTGVLSSELFREIGARTFAMAGTHRCSNSDATLCDGSTTSCGSPSQSYRESDMAHTDSAFFQVFHEAASEETVSTRVIQVHGFSSDASDPEFTASDGRTANNPSGTYLSNHFTSVLESKIEGDSSKGGNSCNLEGDINLLCGTTNTQGRFTNGVASDDVCDTAASSATGLFLHAELSYDLRHTGGTVEPSAFIDTVKEVCSCSATLVELASFTATRQQQTAVVQWSTAAEVDNAGFHLWRSNTEDGPYVCITDHLIPAEGTPAWGAAYEHTDRDVLPHQTYYYKLEDVDNTGKSTFHGPVSTIPQATGQPDLVVISQREDGLALELTLPPFELEAVQGPDSWYQRIALDQWTKMARPGFPEIPLTGALIQTPESGKIEVHVIEGEYEVISNCNLYPAPELVRSQDGTSIPVFSKNNEIYASSDFFPGNLARVSALSAMRRVPVARVTLFPFQWHPGTGELRYYTKIRVNVQFERPLGHIDSTAQPGREKDCPARAYFETLKKRAILNYSRRRQTRRTRWRLPALFRPRPRAALRVEVNQTGMYRMTYEDLIAAGLPRRVHADTLQLFNQGSEVAIKVVSRGRGRRLRSGDQLVFFGKGVDDPYTDTNVYWLRWGRRLGKRMDLIDGSVAAWGIIHPESFSELVHQEENHVIWASMPGAPENDYWFWEKITAPNTSEYIVDIPSPDVDRAEALVRVALRGRSTDPVYPNHHTIISMNGTLIGDVHWDGNGEYVHEMPVSPAFFQDGPNTLRIESPGDTGARADIVYFNWVEVDYHRYPEAADDRLRFTVEESNTLGMELSRFCDPLISVYDITRDSDPIEITGLFIEPDGETYTAIFEDLVGGTKTYYALSEEGFIQPYKIARWQPSNLRHGGNGADWIVITSEKLLDSVAPLVRFRKRQGLRARTVSVEDIYNTFNHGLEDPRAIKDFLQNAYDNWAPPAPTYVFLVGDANTDYRDYLKTGKENVVPPHLMQTGLGVTPEDNWYVCMDGEQDILPDMFIGRIPGDSPAMVTALVDKIINYESSDNSVNDQVLFVADDNEPTFERLNDALVDYLPEGFDANRVYLSSYASEAQATWDLLDYLDQGMLITNYVGHGSVTNWAGEYLFESAHIPDLLNQGRLTFVVTMTCLNGYFSHPYYYSLAEALMAAEHTGAIGCFSPTGIGYTWQHEILNKEVFANVFNLKTPDLGSITTQAKIDAYAKGISADMVKTYVLFGDPATKLKLNN
ncbi:MAG: C25 family cysteine peptidase [Myxococcota bacterium]|nr:C25 family cysteine peptidase [Myxococcota bacterium]